MSLKGLVFPAVTNNIRTTSAQITQSSGDNGPKPEVEEGEQGGGRTRVITVRQTAKAGDVSEHCLQLNQDFGPDLMPLSDVMRNCAFALSGIYHLQNYNVGFGHYNGCYQYYTNRALTLEERQIAGLKAIGSALVANDKETATLAGLKAGITRLIELFLDLGHLMETDVEYE